MRAVLIRVRATLAGRGTSTAALGLVVAVVVALVLTLAAGARRTASAPDRYTRSVGGDADTILFQGRGAPQSDAVRALPEVEDLRSFTYTVVAQDVPNDGGGAAIFSGDGYLDLELEAGRMPSPTEPGEFVASQGYLDATGLDIGDHVPTSLFTQEQTDSGEAYQVPPDGPTLDTTLVGVVSSVSVLDDPTPLVLFSPALLQEPVGVVSTLMTIRLAGGSTVDDLRQAVQSVPDHETMFFQPGQIVSVSTRTAVSSQAAGLWIIAGVAALAAVAALGQLLVRFVRATAADRRDLAALGYTANQTTAEDVLRALAIVVIGVVVAMVLAALASPLFPRGFVRILEPDAGSISVDWTLLGLGGLVFAALLLGWVTIASLLGRRQPALEKPSAAAEAAARAGLGPAAAAGVRLALLRQGRDRVSARATVATLCVSIGAFMAAVVFAASLTRVVDDPGRSGADFDYAIGGGTGIGLDEAAVDAATTDPAITAAMRLSEANVPGDEEDIDVVGVEVLRGGYTPRVLEGRFPASADEVALGRITARQLGVTIGDQVTFAAASGDLVAYSVVGYAVIPSVGSGQGAGHGATMLRSGLEALQPDEDTELLAIRLRPGATLPEALNPFDVGEPDVGVKPADVVNLSRSRSVPTVLAGLIGTLATVTLAQALLASVRWRRRDLAVLRSLGADGPWVGRAIHVQASTMAAIALVIGLPIGILVGRAAFEALADHFGLVPDPATPVTLVVGVVVGALVVANVAAALPAARARRTPLALLLRSE